MSEATLQTELKALFDANDTFATGSVLINESNILDKSADNAPYIFIWSADDIDSSFRTGGVDIDYESIVALIVAYDNSQPEKISRDAFTTARDSVISTLKDNDLDTGTITAFRSLTGIDPITYNDDSRANPVFLAQVFTVTMRDDD